MQSQQLRYSLPSKVGKQVYMWYTSDLRAIADQPWYFVWTDDCTKVGQEATSPLFAHFLGGSKLPRVTLELRFPSGNDSQMVFLVCARCCHHLAQPHQIFDCDVLPCVYGHPQRRNCRAPQSHSHHNRGNDTCGLPHERKYMTHGDRQVVYLNRSHLSLLRDSSK